MLNPSLPKPFVKRHAKPRRPAELDLALLDLRLPLHPGHPRPAALRQGVGVERGDRMQRPHLAAL